MSGSFLFRRPATLFAAMQLVVAGVLVQDTSAASLNKDYYQEMESGRLLKLAANLIKQKENSEAHKILTVLVKRPDDSIRLEVGKIQARRTDSLKDPKKAIRIFEKILNGRSAVRDKAAFELARLYRTDTELKKTSEALPMYKLAANLGNEKAYSEIAQLYLNGVGVERDLGKALEYLEITAKKQSTAPIIAFARYLARSPEDNTIGLNPQAVVNTHYPSLRKEATSGYPAAAKELARLHVDGDLKPKNLEKARRWLRQAVIGGDIGALRDLALLEFSTGASTSSKARSIAMLREAAAAGNRAAKQTLSKIEDQQMGNSAGG